MTATGEHLMEMAELGTMVSAKDIEEARDSMDIESVSNLRFDRRGRLEAGVKPAPPSTERPAYVRITRRGSRYQVDCRLHGKKGWCPHAVILMLHHLGQKPNYKVRTAAPRPLPKIGFRTAVRFESDGAFFRVIGLSTGRYLNNPLGYLKREHASLDLPQGAIELIQDLGEPGEDGFTVERLDLAPLLSALDRAELFTFEGEAYQRNRGKGEPPRVFVEIRGKQIEWRAEPVIEGDSVFVPGWPGYMIAGHEIRRYPGYVPDLQYLTGRSHALPMTSENLLAFLKQKHQIYWLSGKPEWIQDPDSFGIKMSPDGRDLKAETGVWKNGRFYRLENLQDTHQLTRSRNQPVLISLPLPGLTRLAAARQKLRVPWSGAGFRIRETGARRFLENTDFPKEWRVEREDADRWFGLTQLSLTSSWPEDVSEPIYWIGEESFDHRTLMDGLLEGERGVRLRDGRLLNVDILELQANEDVLSGVRSIHESPESRRDLARRILEETSEAEPPAIPEIWSKILRPYQKEGVGWLLGNHSRCEPSLLADDMGLGKTVQALAYLDIVREDRPQLVVVPRSLLANWHNECLNFCRHRNITIHHGPGRCKDPDELQKKDLIFTTYGTILRDIDFLYDVAFQTVVLDEAQAVKNAASQTARAVSELWADHRLALTGTPVENKLEEPWSIFQFLAPGYLGESEGLKHLYPGTAGFASFKARVGPFLKRRLKSEVEPDLPEKQEILITLPLSDIQTELYQACYRNIHLDLDKKNTRALSLLTKLLRLRQISCHPGLVDERYLTASSNKLDFLADHLSEVVDAGHAALVFSQFTRMLRLVRFELEERGHPYFYLDGATRNRSELVERFQEGERQIFLISLKAGGTGLNLTRASYVYHLDPWWNPMAEAQATDRVHRIGQTQKVFSYKLISEGTVEKKILKLQASKRILAEGLWQEDAKLDRQTLLALLDGT